MAERSSSSATMSRTRCAGCPLGTNSCTEGGSSQVSSTFQGRKLFVMPASESPPAPCVEPIQPLPGQAPSQKKGRHLRRRPKSVVSGGTQEEDDQAPSGPARRLSEEGVAASVSRKNLLQSQKVIRPPGQSGM